MASCSLFEYGPTVCILILGVLLAHSGSEVETKTRSERRTIPRDHTRQVRNVSNSSTHVSTSKNERRPPVYIRPANGSDVGCRELRSKRYVTDGHCKSMRPLIEVVCSGQCLPIRNLPWYADFVRIWAKTSAMEWRCKDDVVRKRRVTLVCDNGSSIIYQVKVVRNCRCEQINRHEENHSDRRDLDKPQEVNENSRQRAPQKKKLKQQMQLSHNDSRVLIS